MATHNGFKMCDTCYCSKQLHAFRVATGTFGRADTCRMCEERTRIDKAEEEGLLVCMACGEAKKPTAFRPHYTNRKKREKVCRRCELEESVVYASPMEGHHTKRKEGPTPLYKATPRKPFSEWTEAEKQHYYAVLKTAPEERK